MARKEVPSYESSIKAFDFDTNESGTFPRTITVYRKSEFGTRGGGAATAESRAFLCFFHQGLAWKFRDPRFPSGAESVETLNSQLSSRL